jgi:hypothetical protein
VESLDRGLAEAAARPPKTCLTSGFGRLVPRRLAQNRVRDVDRGTVHPSGGKRRIESTPSSPDERLRLGHLRLAWCLSNDDPVRGAWAPPSHEGALLKRTVVTASERSLGVHVLILGFRAAGLDGPACRRRREPAAGCYVGGVAGSFPLAWLLVTVEAPLTCGFGPSTRPRSAPDSPRSGMRASEEADEAAGPDAVTYHYRPQHM